MPVTTIESWSLDGLQLTSGAFTLLELTADPPKERQDWITAADSESAALFRQPKHENRTISLKLRVTPQASMNAALDQVGALRDKLAKASSTTAGVPLVWTPTDSSRSVTFTVLTGEIAGLPISKGDGDGLSWLLHRPIVAIELTCQPYWFGVEVLTSTNSSSTPFNAFEIAGVTGDIPALGRLIITDTATQSRRHVEWGLEGPLTYNSATSLLVDSDNMVVTGFSGVQAVTTGAYDPNATGNNSITLTPIAGATTAMAGTGDPLSHVGVFRVKARVQSGSLSNLFRLSWKAGDGPTNHNTWATPISTAGWQELDLGTITVPAVTLGTQRWTGQVEVQGAASSPGTVALDYLILVPQADGYGKARAVWSLGTGVLVAQDSFVGTTAGNALNTRTAPLGGTWATSGDTGDYLFADNFNVSALDGIESIMRTGAGSAETTGRFAILGSTSYTDTQVDVRFLIGASAVTYEAGLIARWVDASNHLRLVIPQNSSSSTVVKLESVIAGSVTTLAQTPAMAIPSGKIYRARLIVYSTGRAIGQVLTDAGGLVCSVDATSSALASGGTLQTGKPGLRDRTAGAGFSSKNYTGFAASVPAAEPIALYSVRSMQVRWDDTLRQDSSATYYGRPPSYRGSRFLLQPGTSRVLVKARRNDIESALDDNVTDALQLQVGWTPRGLAVPR
jgi:hypothetical protein